MLDILSVKQLLQIPSFKNSLILTGDTGLERKVSGFVIVDNLEVLDRIQGGELVCSSAGGFKDPLTLKSRMLDLEKRGASLWAYRLEDSNQAIPEDLISLAIMHNFPLIVFGPETRWHRVVEGLMSYIQEIENHQKEQGLLIRDQLTKLVLSSDGLRNIVTFLSEQVYNPVILVDRFFNTITDSFPHNFDVLSFPDGNLSLEIKKQLKGRSQFKSIPIKKHSYITSETLIIKDMIYPLFMMPLYLEDFFFGWLILVSLNDAQSYLYPIIMEHGSTVLALELQKEKKELEALTRTKDGFFQSIVEGHDLSPQEMRKRINLLGIYLHSRFIIFVIDIKPAIFFHHVKELKSLLMFHDSYATLIESKEELVAFFHPKINLKQMHSNAEIKKIAQKLTDFLTKKGYYSYIGISKCNEGYQKIVSAYLEAKQALQKAILDNQQIVGYHDLGLERLFSLFLDKKDLTDFSHDILENLLLYDQKNNTEFYKTLYYYLSNNQNSSKTARDMNLHINSVNYRLQRIQEILNINFSNSDAVMTLYFAVKVHQYIKE